MRQKMFFAWIVIVLRMMLANFTRINIEAILTLFGETAWWSKNRVKEREETMNNLIEQFNNRIGILCVTYLMLNVTVSSTTVCVTYLDSFFSSMPFLCNVAMKSVRARDIRNCSSSVRDANIRGPCENKQLDYNRAICGFAVLFD